VAIAIIAVLAAVAIPNFMRRRPLYERKQFIDHMNALMQVAWQNSVVTHKLHRITFDLSKRLIFIEVETDKKTPTGAQLFVPMNSKYINSTYEWNENTFEIKNFYVGRRDELHLTLDERGKGKIWFFIVPEGLVQPVILNILDIKDVQPGEKGTEFSLVLNPFSAQFKEYDTFQKPE
jgi:hypothetical protein